MMYLNLSLGNTTLADVLERSKDGKVNIPMNGSTCILLWEPGTEFSYENETNVFFTTTYENIKRLQAACGPDWTNRKIVELAIARHQRFTRHDNTVHFGARYNEKYLTIGIKHNLIK